MKIKLYKDNRIKRKLRVKKKVFGTSSKPRLSVFRSNKYIYGRIIDDTLGIVLVDSSDKVKSLHKGKNKIEASKKVGELLAKRSKEAKVKSVVFDRNGYKYHGRVKSLADGARAGGLKF